MAKCDGCGRRGKPYTYHDIEFDGLTAVRGERLCPGCAAESVRTDGVNISSRTWVGAPEVVSNTREMAGKAFPSSVRA